MLIIEKDSDRIRIVKLVIFGKNKRFVRAYWLAEQGLALKRALLVVVPLIVIFLMEHIKHVFERKGDKNMGKTKKAFEALHIILNYIINLSCNIAGGALLANVF